MPSLNKNKILRENLMCRLKKFLLQNNCPGFPGQLFINSYDKFTNVLYYMYHNILTAIFIKPAIKSTGMIDQRHI